MDKLIIDMGAVNLVVEKDISGEFVVYLQDKKTNCITQDIATVRPTQKDGEHLGAVDCLVWTDEYSEDYTHKFTIKQFAED